MRSTVISYCLYKYRAGVQYKVVHATAANTRVLQHMPTLAGNIIPVVYYYQYINTKTQDACYGTRLHFISF